ncbi:MAG: hypothetical protein ACR2I1_06955 [Propionibacteriaceae bacterium]
MVDPGYPAPPVSNTFMASTLSSWKTETKAWRSRVDRAFPSWESHPDRLTA